MNKTLAIFLPLLLLLCVGCHKHSVLYGKVVDAESKEPIAGALVESTSYVERPDMKDFSPRGDIHNPDDRRKSDKYGRFRIKYRVPYIYMGHFEGPVVPGVVIKARGYEPLRIGGSQIGGLPVYPDKLNLVRLYPLHRAGADDVQPTQSTLDP